MAAEIDIRAISVLASLPEATIASLLDAPTVDTIKSLLKGIENTAKDYEQLKAQRVRLEVELETIVRTSESKTKVLQTSRDKALADASKLRTELQSSETNRVRLEADIDQFRSSTSAEATELTSLRSRISSLEAANRDTLGLLESKTTAYDRLAQDLNAQHQKASELRKQISTLEQSVQTSNSSLASSKFREQSLSQELDLSKKSSDWLENERKIKADEHATFRKEKNARISELSRQNEQYISDAEALRRSESSLKHRLEEQITKHEELLQELQRLREEKIAEADGFRVELESVNRLAELQKASADTAKERVQELSEALEEVREEASDEIGRIRAEAESEHADKLAAETRVSELETSLQQLRSELEQSRVRPSTPQQNIHANGLSTPNRPGTPLGIFSPSSTSRLKGSLSTTQLYTEYKKLEKELAGEKRNSEELQNQLDAMLEDLEASKPEFDELRADHSRLQGEVLEMSNLVDRANEERDVSAKSARTFHGQLDAKTKEIAVLSQQLRDAGSEIRYLLMEQYVQSQGDSLSREDFEELQKQADQALEQETSNMSETQKLVNEQLIAFKSISELQEQNKNQLETIRKLVSNLESNESQERQQRQAEVEQELDSAKAQIAGFQEEIRTMVNQSKSFIKERDMFRNMLTRRGQFNEPMDFSRSLPIPAGGSPAGVAQAGSVTGGDSDYAKLLKDLQQHFDSYRQEAATDHTSLKSQVDDLSKKNSQLQTEASRAFGQLSAANSRCEMLQSNINMLKTENSEIQRRSYVAMENATKQEMKTQQAAEDLVETRGLLDGLRRESANLKAEKDLWKNVEKRLIDDNESLRNERGRLDSLNANLQNLLNERDQTDSETRRRLQAQVESLDGELQSAKRKLNEEIEEAKKATLRREYEHEQNQKRIDDLVTSLGTVREDLMGAKTSRDYLQARVDELSVELKSAEERIDLLTKPPTEAPSGLNGVDEDALSKEQELSVEISELKRDLVLKTTELERAIEQIEVYKNISQTSEERLQELSETNDQYREDTDALVTEKDAKIKNFEQRIEDISAELNTTNNELSQLRDEHSESRRKLEEQKTSFESEIERLKNQDLRNAEQAQFNLEASKVQAQIATEAQQNYETELLKHAEAAKNLQAVRNELNQLRLDMVNLRTQAETAQTTLEQKESSWTDMKDRFEREVSDLKKRREEVLNQNTILHGQLESVTQQITTLQKDRAALTEGDAPGAPANGLDSLQEVIKYLRREKEIVDVQYHLSTQEAKRLRQQLDLAQSQLDDTRVKLDQQRRAEADVDRNATSHAKLMEAINELNLHRESSVTLRSEARQATQALVEKTQRVEQLESQLQPLQARIVELENLTELREGEMKLLQEDRDHWQQRTQNILSKYDRVDPAELETLKTQITTLETERDEALSTNNALQTQVDGIAEQVEAAKSELRSRLGEQFRNKVKDLNSKIKEKQTEVDNALAEKSQVQKELDVVREQLESAHNHAATSPNTQVNGSNGAEQDPSTVPEELTSKLSELQSQLVQKEEILTNYKNEAEAKSKARDTELRDRLNKRLGEVKQEAQKAKEAALDELREQLNLEHQQELEALRSQSVPISAELQKSADPQESVPTQETPSLELTNAHLESITDDQARFLVQKNELIQRILKNNIRKQVEKELTKQGTTQDQSTTEASSSVEPNNELERKFNEEKEAILKEKEAEFATERDNLLEQHEQRLVQEKQELVIKHQEELSLLRLEFSEDSAKRIAEQVALATAMAEKKGQTLLNMARRQATTVQCKIDVVRTAAEETPEKPVSEVWAIAKEAKPAPAPQSTPSVVSKPTTNPFAAGSASQQSTAAATGASTAAPQAVSTTDAPAKAVEPKAEPSSAEDTDEPGKSAQQNVGAGTAVPRGISSLPRGGGSIRGRGGPQGLQTSQQSSGIPQPQGMGRGTGIPRGAPRGRGGERGGARGGLNTSQAPAGRGRGGATPDSPSRGAFNPQAQQFTPGSKRTREDGETGDSVNGKRIRGGGAGSN